MCGEFVIVNEKEFNRKVAQIKKDGFSNLHIITDFDRTLTTGEVDGKEFKSVIALLREDNYLDQDYVIKAEELYDKYHLFVDDPTISPEERSEKMTRWWQEHLDLQIEKGLTKEVIDRLCKDTKYKLQFRHGIKEFIEILKNNNVPMLVLSAGWGDVIEYCLRENNLLYEGISIVSNFFNYDEFGRITGYKEEIIHSANKGDVAIARHPHFSKIKDRENVILLGDNLGDLDMAEGIEHKEIIKICFLPKNKNLEDFLGYDVIILNDGPLNFVIELLKKLD